MITDAVRQRVNQWFGTEVEFCKQIFQALEADESLLFLGRKLRRETWEQAELKKIQELHRNDQTTIVEEDEVAAVPRCDPSKVNPLTSESNGTIVKGRALDRGACE